jgi:hypothetical protein
MILPVVSHEAWKRCSLSEGSILRILVPSSSWFSSMRWIQLDLTLALQPQITSASSAPPFAPLLSQDTPKKKQLRRPYSKGGYRSSDTDCQGQGDRTHFGPDIPSLLFEPFYRQ